MKDGSISQSGNKLVLRGSFVYMNSWTRTFRSDSVSVFIRRSSSAVGPTLNQLLCIWMILVFYRRYSQGCFYFLFSSGLISLVLTHEGESIFVVRWFFRWKIRVDIFPWHYTEFLFAFAPVSLHILCTAVASLTHSYVIYFVLNNHIML